EHHRASTALHRLMTADAHPHGNLINTGPLKPFQNWAVAFDHAGQALRHLSDDAALHRGLRAVLAHHVLFHWNRIGLPAHVQGTLAALARQIVMGNPTGPVSTPGAGLAADRLSRMETEIADAATANPETENPGKLREALVDQLRDRGAIRSPQVEAAMRT